MEAMTKLDYFPVQQLPLLSPVEVLHVFQLGPIDLGQENLPL